MFDEKCVAFLIRVYPLRYQGTNQLVGVALPDPIAYILAARLEDVHILASVSDTPGANVRVWTTVDGQRVEGLAFVPPPLVTLGNRGLFGGCHGWLGGVLNVTSLLLAVVNNIAPVTNRMVINTTIPDVDVALSLRINNTTYTTSNLPASVGMLVGTVANGSSALMNKTHDYYNIKIKQIQNKTNIAKENLKTLLDDLSARVENGMMQATSRLLASMPFLAKKAAAVVNMTEELLKRANKDVLHPGPPTKTWATCKHKGQEFNGARWLLDGQHFYTCPYCDVLYPAGSRIHPTSWVDRPAGGVRVPPKSKSSSPHADIVPAMAALTISATPALFNPAQPKCFVPETKPYVQPPAVHAETSGTSPTAIGLVNPYAELLLPSATADVARADPAALPPSKQVTDVKMDDEKIDPPRPFRFSGPVSSAFSVGSGPFSTAGSSVSAFAVPAPVTERARNKSAGLGQAVHEDQQSQSFTAVVGPVPCVTQVHVDQSAAAAPAISNTPTTVVSGGLPSATAPPMPIMSTKSVQTEHRREDTDIATITVDCPDQESPPHKIEPIEPMLCGDLPEIDQVCEIASEQLGETRYPSEFKLREFVLKFGSNVCRLVSNRGSAVETAPMQLYQYSTRGCGFRIAWYDLVCPVLIPYAKRYSDLIVPSLCTELQFYVIAIAVCCVPLIVRYLELFAFGTHHPVFSAFAVVPTFAVALLVYANDGNIPLLLLCVWVIDCLLLVIDYRVAYRHEGPFTCTYCGDQAFFYYVPHWCTVVFNSIDPNQSLDTLKTTITRKMEQVASLPITDSVYSPARMFTAAVILKKVVSKNYYTSQEIRFGKLLTCTTKTN
jgi:hypothetical protein